MGIVAGAAPQAAIAVSCASAQGKLLDVADDLEIARGRACRRGIVKDRVGVFRPLAWDKVAELSCRIGDPSYPEQVALFADAVASGGLELCGIDDGAGPGISQVALDRPVTAFACDCFGRKDGCAKGIQRARNVQGLAGMAEQALFANRPGEIRVRRVFVTWS